MHCPPIKHSTLPLPASRTSAQALPPAHPFNGSSDCSLQPEDESGMTQCLVKRVAALPLRDALPCGRIEPLAPLLLHVLLGSANWVPGSHLQACSTRSHILTSVQGTAECTGYCGGQVHAKPSTGPCRQVWQYLSHKGDPSWHVDDQAFLRGAHAESTKQTVHCSASLPAQCPTARSLTLSHPPYQHPPAASSSPCWARCPQS